MFFHPPVANAVDNNRLLSMSTTREMKVIDFRWEEWQQNKVLRKYVFAVRGEPLSKKDTFNFNPYLAP
jgi:hypothetical protein